MGDEGGGGKRQSGGEGGGNGGRISMRACLKIGWEKLLPGSVYGVIRPSARLGSAGSKFAGFVRRSVKAYAWHMRSRCFFSSLRCAVREHVVPRPTHLADGWLVPSYLCTAVAGPFSLPPFHTPVCVCVCGRSLSPPLPAKLCTVAASFSKTNEK